MIAHISTRTAVRLTLAFCAWPLFAQTSPRYDGAAWSLLDSTAVMSAASGLTAAKHPDSDDVIVESKLMRVYHADGTAESQDETFTKVLTEKGKRNNRTVTRGFMLPYSSVAIIRLEILRADGAVVPVDIAANSKESIDDSQMEANIYDPNVRILRVNIPQLDPGDVVHLVTRTTTERPYIPGEFADINVFEGSSYIRHVSYEIRAPAEKPLRHQILRDAVPGTVTATTHPGDNNTIVYHWDVNNVRRMFDEPGMPSYSEVLQRLVVSSTKDWPAISRWYWELSKAHLDAVSPEMKKLVGELTASPATDQEKMKAVFYYVSKNIRYMGLTPEKDRPGFEPHDVCVTFDKKYGVCRDKAALLVSMLRAAGLTAYPVLVSIGVKRDRDSPDPFFNHAIVGVEATKGNYVLMDPTDENTVDLLPSYESDQSYLVCRPEGEELMTSAIPPPEKNMMRIETTGQLDATGALQARSEMWFDGINDNAYRNFFAKAKPDEIRRFFEERVKGVLPGAVVKTLSVTPANMLDASQPVHAVVEYAAANTTAFGSGQAVVTVPWIGRDLGIVGFILNDTGLEKRLYPLRTGIACGLQEDIAIKLAPGFSGAVSIPNCAPVEDASVGYQRQFSLADGVLRCARDLKLKQVQLSPAEYLVLKQTLEGMGNDSRKAPILAISDDTRTKAPPAALPPAPVAVESDSRQIETQEVLTVKGAHDAVLKVKTVREVLTYNGKKKESEIKIGYNPADQDVHLLHAVVTTKGGERHAISPGEINIMDAGWNAQAKRYTGEKLLVANLPGVEIGSTIDLEFELVTHGKPYLSAFVPFQAFNELEKKSFQISAPPGLEVQQIETGPAGFIKAALTTTNEGQIFKWSAEHVTALPSEPELPPNWAYRAGVEYFIGDESVYLKELHEALLQRATQATQAAAKARELIAHATSPREAATAIRDFVARSIRLAGPNFNALPLGELSAADTTLADGYGHAADRAILLYALLSAADFKPDFVLASGLPAIAELSRTATAFPLPDAFHTPLVRIKLDGESYYLNDTDQYARLGATSFDGRLARQLSNQAFITITIPEECRTKIATDFQVAVTDTGKTRITQVNHFYGQRFAEQNKFFTELPPEERRRHFQEMVTGVAQGARPIGDLITKFDTYPGIEQFTVEVDHYSVVDGKYLYFDLPFTPGMFRVGADQRTLPLYLGNNSDWSIRTVVELPPAFRHIVIAPQSAALTAPGGAGRAEIATTQNAGTFVITHQLKASPAIVTARDYPGVLSLESTLQNKSSKLLLLKSD